MKKHSIVLSFLLLFFGMICINSKITKASDFIVCIDAGHQQKGDNRLEAVGPGDGFSKPKVSSGTRGVATKKWEYEVTLECAKTLKELLQPENSVYLTRESNDVNISNSERARFANEKNADIHIRLHCDSIHNSAKTGASILVPSKTGKYTKKIYKESYKYALELSEKLKESGIKVNGIFERADITGFNYSTVPTVILEMGFMSNYIEDKMLCSKQYQSKLMNAIKLSIESYKKIKNVEN